MRVHGCQGWLAILGAVACATPDDSGYGYSATGGSAAASGTAGGGHGGAGAASGGTGAAGGGHGGAGAASGGTGAAAATGGVAGTAGTAGTAASAGLGGAAGSGGTGGTAGQGSCKDAFCPNDGTHAPCCVTPDGPCGVKIGQDCVENGSTGGSGGTFGTGGAGGGSPCLYCVGTCSTFTEDSACYVDCLVNQFASGCVWQNGVCTCT
jgi:hypothetical protein